MSREDYWRTSRWSVRLPHLEPYATHTAADWIGVLVCTPGAIMGTAWVAAVETTCLPVALPALLAASLVLAGLCLRQAPGARRA